MAFQHCWVRQRPLHIDHSNSGDVTRQHRERPAIFGPGDLATPATIAHVKGLPNDSPIGSLESDIDLRAVEDGDFLARRDPVVLHFIPSRW